MCEYQSNNPQPEYKTIEFSEDQLGNLNAIAAQMLNDVNDPRSYAYVRKLVRPPIRWWRIALFTLLPILVGFAAWQIMRACELPDWIAPVAIGIACLIYVAVNLRSAVICSIRIYQRYAPSSLRNKCRFEPSCSQYMILSIQKYGLWKGLRNGIRRLKRCNIHNGGYDEP